MAFQLEVAATLPFSVAARGPGGEGGGLSHIAQIIQSVKLKTQRSVRTQTRITNAGAGNSRYNNAIGIEKYERLVS